MSDGEVADFRSETDVEALAYTGGHQPAESEDI